MPSLTGFKGAPTERRLLVGAVDGESVWQCRVCLSRLTCSADAICAHCAARGRTWLDDGRGLRMDMEEGVFG